MMRCTTEAMDRSSACMTDSNNLRSSSVTKVTTRFEREIFRESFGLPFFCLFFDEVSFIVLFLNLSVDRWLPAREFILNKQKLVIAVTSLILLNELGNTSHQEIEDVQS